MSRSFFLFSILLLAGASMPGRMASAQPREVAHERAMATERMIDSTGDEALRAYALEHFTPTHRESFAEEADLLAHLRELRAAVAPIGGVGLEKVGPHALALHVSNRQTESVVRIELEEQAPYRIARLELVSTGPAEPAMDVSWETLEDTLLEAEREGFSGSVLAVRDGEVVLDQGFGHADPDGRHPVTPTTIFAIGSTPIDFTHAAILKLREMGRLSLDDPITDYFDDVPADKRGITLEHLRTSRSGLRNFHGIEGVDENLDLTWIDRETAMQRIFSKELLFPPGEGERHSHSAWGVLAAVVEIVSGQGYHEFLREHFFEPAGMDRTGPYAFSRKFPASEIAVGLGGNVFGEVNSPPHWGRTSWLVLGSGGMVSTPRDLYRWRQHLASGKAFGEEAQRLYGIGGILVDEGGNDRGFLTAMAVRGDDQFILCSNSHVEMDDAVADLARALERMVLRE